MPMHFIGGLWLGLFFIYLFYIPSESFRFSSESKALILKILLFVLSIGVGWELFEILFNNIIAKIPFNSLDTISDVFFDLSGGSFAVLYFLKFIMFTEKNTL